MSPIYDARARNSSFGDAPVTLSPVNSFGDAPVNSAPTPGGPKPPGTLQDALAHEGFLDSAWQAIKGPFAAVADIATGEAAKRHAALMQKSKELEANGTPEQQREFAKQNLLENIPFASTLYKLYKGNLSGAAGDVAGLGVLGGAGALGGAAVDMAKGATTADPAVGLARALRPAAANSDFAESIPGAIADIKTHGGSVVSNDSLRIAAGNAMKKAQDTLEQWMDKKRPLGAIANGADIARATSQAIPDTMRVEDPQLAADLTQKSQAAYSRNFTVDQLRQLLREKNAELSSFYDKTTGKQQASVTSGSPQAVVKAQRDAVADLLYRTLDPDNGGAGPREIQQRYGAMKELYDAADKRRNAILQEKPLTPAGAVGKIAAAVADIPGKVLHGDTEGAFAGLLAPFRGISDPLIRQSFSAAGKASPFPTPP